MIEYRDTHDIDLDQLASLMSTAGWEQRTNPRERLEKQVRNSAYVVSAWDGKRLVGFARAISDDATNAYISTVVVHPDHQRRGIGRELLARLMRDRDGITFVLHARAEVHPFYSKAGFVQSPNLFRRPRSF